MNKIMEAARNLDWLELSPAKVAEGWKNMVTMDIIEGLDCPQLTAHAVPGYEVCVVKFNKVGLVLMSRPIVGTMGNYGLVAKFTSTLVSREIRMACICCGPQRHIAGGEIDHSPRKDPSDFFGNLGALKMELGLESVIVQSGDRHLPNWATDMTKINGVVPFPKEIPLYVVEKGIMRHISEPEQK